MTATIISEVYGTFDASPTTLYLNTVGADALAVMVIKGYMDNDVALSGVKVNGAPMINKAQGIYHLANPYQMASCPIVVSGTATSLARIWAVAIREGGRFIGANQIGGVENPSISVASEPGAMVFYVWMHRTSGYLTNDYSTGYATYHEEIGGDGTRLYRAMAKLSTLTSESGTVVFGDGYETSIELLTVARLPSVDVSAVFISDFGVM